MSGKRCHDDLHNHVLEDEQNPLRPRHDFQNNSVQLRELINQQLQMLEPDSLNMIERLHEIIDEQHEHLAMDEQIGAGPSNDASDYDPMAPDMGLSRNFIDRLIADGGRVGDFTVNPRSRFNRVEIRSLNFREIAADDYAAYNIFLQDILREIIDFSRLMAGDDGFINVSSAM